MSDPSFLAPELFLDEAPYTIASDLWALGCIMYQMATGRLPFAKLSKSQIAQQHLQAKLRQPACKSLLHRKFVGHNLGSH